MMFSVLDIPGSMVDLRKHCKIGCDLLVAGWRASVCIHATGLANAGAVPTIQRRAGDRGCTPAMLLPTSPISSAPLHQHPAPAQCSPQAGPLPLLLQPTHSALALPLHTCTKLSAPPPALHTTLAVMGGWRQPGWAAREVVRLLYTIRGSRDDCMRAADGRCQCLTDTCVGPLWAHASRTGPQQLWGCTQTWES